MKIKHILIFVLILLFFLTGVSFASHSTITIAEGVAAMGDDKSRNKTESAAMTEAKRNAAEQALTYVRSETKVKNFELEDDIMDAYSKASVKVLEILDSGWFTDRVTGACYRIKIKAEVVPDMKKTESNPGYDNLLDDPRAPLSVKIWTNEREYNEGDKIKIYLKGNKPFFARVIYKDVSGNLIQLLPNCYRTENYFNGGTIYEIPSGCDKFELDVTPPFGRENIIVYASTKPLGNIDKKDIGGIYTLNNSLNDVSGRSRGVVIRPTGDRTENTAEFIEVNTEIATR